MASKGAAGVNERPAPIKKHRLLNCFTMGFAEHGRLGIGPPDDARQVFESGQTGAASAIGWHQRRDPDKLAPVAVSNVRMRRTHVPGLARLAKLPATLPEANIGSTGGVVLPTPVGKPLVASGPRCVAVATGQSHTLVALEDGRVYGWGSGAEGQLGGAVVKAEVKRAEEVALGRKKIVTGFEAKLEVTNETTVPALSVWTPVLIPPPAAKVIETDMGVEEAPFDPPKQLGCTAKASVMLTTGGKVWCWGSGHFNVLGQTKNGQAEGQREKGDQGPMREGYGCANSSVPVLVRGPVERQTVTQVSCGSYHVLALTLAQKVLAWGRNDDGQLGIGRASPFETPRQVKLNSHKEPAYWVAAGDRHSLAVVELTRADGRVERTAFAWGCKDNGRLGGVGDKRTAEPQEVSSLGRVYKKYRLKGYLKAVAAGKTHSVALTDGERVITWGGGAYGQLGNGFGYDAELPQLIDSIYNIVSIAAGDFHTLAVSSFAIRGGPQNPLKESKLDEAEKLALLKERMLDNMHYEPFGKDDLTKKPPVYLVNDRGVTTDKEVIPRANELWGWGWNGFGELGTGDELPRLSPVRVESMLPASVLAIAAGSHHSIVLTAGYAVRIKEDNQRPFKGYGPYCKKIEAVIAAETASDEKRVMAMMMAGGGNDDDTVPSLGAESTGGSSVKREQKAMQEEANKGKDGKPQLSRAGQMALMLAARPLKREMQYARLDDTLLDDPENLVPDQPGLLGQKDPHGHAAAAAAAAAEATSDDEASVGEASVQSSVGNDSPRGGGGGGGGKGGGGVEPGSPKERAVKEIKEVPRFARKWHAQEAVAPRDFSMGAYCLDTPHNSDKDRYPPLRGSYAAVYHCKICDLTRICLVCARHCHASHCVTVHLKRASDVGGYCDCGCPPLPNDDDGYGPDGKKKRKAKGKVLGGPAAQRAAANDAKTRSKGASLGMVKVKNRCRCQGTTERRIFDKYVDPLDGKVRVRQLEAILLDMHNEARHASDEADAAKGMKLPGSEDDKADSDAGKDGAGAPAAPAGKPAAKAEFDPQDAREAEEALGMLVNGKQVGNAEDASVFDFDPTVGEGGIDWLMFNDWKSKYEEQKRQRTALGGGGADEEDSTVDGEGAAVGEPAKD